MRATIPLFLSLALFLLVAVQPDLGTALIVLILGLVAIFYAGIKLIYPFLSFIAIVLISPFLWNLLKPYQQNRIKIVLNPDLDPLGQGYHIIQSKIAIGSAGERGPVCNHTHTHTPRAQVRTHTLATRSRAHTHTHTQHTPPLRVVEQAGHGWQGCG